MSGVPSRILVGPTTYVHFRHRHRDFFAPDFYLLSDGAAPEDCPHVWRYTVSADHHNTVFFYNATTKKSVWVLPVVFPDGRTAELPEGEVMRPVHSPSPPTRPNDTRTSKAGPTTQKDGVVGDVEGREATQKALVAENTAQSAATREGEMLMNSSLEVPVPSVTFPSLKPTEATMAGGGAAAAAEAPASTSVTGEGEGGVSRARVEAALQRAQLAQPLSVTLNADGSTTNLPGHKPSLQERLAAWRAKRSATPLAADGQRGLPEADANTHGESTAAAGDVKYEGGDGEQQSAPPHLESYEVTQAQTESSPSQAPSASRAAVVVSDPLAAVVDAPVGTAMAQRTPAPAAEPAQSIAASPSSSAAAAASPTPLQPPHAPSAEPTPSRTPAAPTHNTTTMSSTNRRAADTLQERERRAQEAELQRAAALLHREKIAAMEQERAALECRRRAVAAEQLEAEERARMAAQRTAAERARLDEATRQAQAAEQRRQRTAAEAEAAARLREVNAYAVAQQAMEAVAEATVADSFSYAQRIATQLAARAPKVEEVQAVLEPTTKKSTTTAINSTSSSGGPVNNNTSLQEKDEDGSFRPFFRSHHVGKPTADATSLLRTVPPNAMSSSTRGAKTTTAATTHQRPQQQQPQEEEGSDVEAERRTQAQLCYGMPFTYDGEVIDYRPARAFQPSQRLRLQNSQQHLRGDVHSLHETPSLRLGMGSNSALPPDPPLILTARRDGVGTEVYDAAGQHYFRGQWRDDKREGPGVLSLPTTAVQGRWHDDQLTGAAVVQTPKVKANATVANVPSVSGPSSHMTLTGNAAAELRDGSLFVGALRSGRVGAPYVLQLGEGDYLEWLGPSSASSSSSATKKASRAKAPTAATRSTLITRQAARSDSLASTPSPGKHTQAAQASLAKRQGGSAAAEIAAAAAAAGSGECRIRFRSGDTFVGHVRDFQLHGMGYYRFAADGQSYTGEFAHGLPHGSGLMIFANGDLYQGQFAEGLLDGRGSYSSKAGRYVYEGGWVKGQMEGEGTLSYANGDVWQGTFHNSARLNGAYTHVAKSAR